jgi:molybdenum cofactor cytidylyltransferase
MSTGIIILAAGNSSRLGEPKQLLQYKGVSLLNRITTEAVFFAEQGVVVVTGAHHLAIEENINNKDVITCYNPDWKDGMASSIKTGIKQLLLVHPELTNCILTVCDQPYLDAKIFRKLFDKWQQSGKGIVASQYSGTAGIPVLFNRQYFDALLHLEGQEGARKLLTKFNEDVAVVPFEKGVIDIDTIEDYNNLIK